MSEKNSPPPLKKSDFSVANSLRHRRRQLGLTLEDVAQKSGLSPSFVSLAERGKAVPSIVSLINLAKALEVDISYFVEPPHAHQIVHRGSDPEYFPIDSPVTYMRLSGGLRDQKMDAFIHIMPPGPVFPRVQREGESLYYVLEGTLHFEIGDQTYELDAGDSVHFNSQYSYTMQNRGQGPVKFMWVGTPALFEIQKNEEEDAK
jgi:transcriptional regulator with XRE-family HTH domain